MHWAYWLHLVFDPDSRLVVSPGRLPGGGECLADDRRRASLIPGANAAPMEAWAIQPAARPGQTRCWARAPSPVLMARNMEGIFSSGFCGAADGRGVLFWQLGWLRRG